MSPLSNLATRDVETLVHPYINLARFRETGPLIIEREVGDQAARLRDVALGLAYLREFLHG